MTGGPAAHALATAGNNVRFVDGFPGTAGKDSQAAPVYTLLASAGARVTALDFGQETGNEHFVGLTGAASVTLGNASFGLDALWDSPASVQASGFAGRLSVVGALLGKANVAVAGANTDQSVLLAGATFGGWGAAADGSRLESTATAGTARALLVSSNTAGFHDPPNDAAIDDVWLRGMLASTLQDSSRRLTVPPDGATAVRVFRFGSNIAKTTVRVTR